MRRLVLMPLLAGLLACGGAPSGALRGSDATSVRFEGGTAVRYETDADGEPARGLYVGTLQDAVYFAAERRGVRLSGDPRLAELAETLASHLRPGGKLPPEEVTAFFARHLGLTDPEIHSFLVGTPHVSEIGARVTDGVASYLERAPYDRYGAYAFERDGLVIAIVLLAEHRAALEPLPRELDAPGEVHLRGELAEGLSSPALVVIRPSGESERLSLGEGARIDARVRLEERGVHELQLLAVGARGSLPVATMPIAVGVRHATRLDLEAPAQGGAVSTDAATVERELLELLAAARRQAGVSALEVDPELTSLARAHSLDMREASYLGHTSPRYGTPSDRAERAGIRSGLVLENVGRGPDAGSIHRGLEKSPGHRRNMLHPDVTHVGIGVEPDGEGDFLVTQIFVRKAAAIDLADARKKLLDAINASRRSKGQKPLVSDPNLEAAADDGAKAYFADPSLDQRGVVSRASRTAQMHALTFARVGSVMIVVDDIEDALRVESALDADARAIGIGIAQGDRPDVPPSSIAVVVLLGWPR